MIFCHKFAEFSQRLLGGDKGFDRSAATIADTGGGTAQKRIPHGRQLGEDAAILHFAAAFDLGQALVIGQKTLAVQGLQVDQKRISRKGAVGLVGRAAAVGHAEGQRLPVAVAARGKQIDKMNGFLAERAAAVFAGQGGDVH